MNARLPPKTPTGRPPPTILPSVTRSASSSKARSAPPRATRKPVITSSTISSAPSRCGERAQAGEVAGGGRDAAGVADDRLHNHGGDGAGMRGEGGFDGGEVVVGQGQGEVGDLFRHAGRAGNAEGRDAGAGFDQQAVGVAVVAALEFDDDLAAGGGAGQADGATWWPRCRS